MATWKGFRKKLADLVSEMALEAVGTALAILTIAGAHWLLELCIGSDRKFFNFIPVAWCFDVAHLVVLGRLVWRTIRKFKDD